jgi:hypothetical protein
LLLLLGGDALWNNPKGLIPRRRNSSHEIVCAKCRNMMDGCTWVILLNLYSFFAFAVSRTDFYSLAKRNFFSRSLIYLYCACTISLFRAKYFAFRREKAPPSFLGPIGMKLDIIILSNIPHRLTVFDFSFLILEARYKQFLTRHLIYTRHYRV